MLPNDLKNDVLELAAIAKGCPEGLTDKCFELLLTYYLNQIEGAGRREPATAADGSDPAALSQHETANNSAAAQNVATDHDLTVKDLHVKARKFLEKYERTIDDLNQILFKEGDQLRPLFEDLKALSENS